MPRQAAPRWVVGEGRGSQGALGGAATMLRSLLLHSLRLCAQTASCLALFPRFLGTAFMLWLLDFLCIRKHLLGRRRRGQPETEVELNSDGEEVPPDDPPVCVSDDNRLCTLASLRAVWHGQKLDFFKQAHEGGPAPNSEVVLPDGFQNQHILDYARGNRPLVLNFGSCT
ncbi:thyroxine 5-deiodinase [Cervus elaphus]|uniref:thyroxine 5-deiodinase n=1 Tax=Cervus canadensis TaxID=1574408 RepID=UPI001C9E761D|nr:thyroxine 5-deiodinase [Cervus canadensis]XP_043778398.1 thyroxine 5-deiodinase [Cervus elaphus]